MKRHFTPLALHQLLNGPANAPEVMRAIEHLIECRHCWAVAADDLTSRHNVVKHRVADGRDALVALLEEEASRALEASRAKAWWAEIKDLDLDQQIEKIRSVKAFRCLPVFDAILTEARRSGFSDPQRGASTARLALLIATLLPETEFPGPVKNDLRGQTFTVMANCRRLAADWAATAKALDEARLHLGQGTGDPGLKAGLLSIQCSFQNDVGNLESALQSVSMAIEIYRELEDWQGVAHNLILEASCFLANLQPSEAVERANFALQRVPVYDIRLQCLARLIITEGLVSAGRTMEALRSFTAGKTILEQSSDPGMQLKSSYVEARLLDSLGFARESEKLFRDAIDTYFDHELYRDGFLVLLTLFESLCRRGAIRKATALCEAAVAVASQAGEACNDLVREAWKELQKTVRTRQLTNSEFDHARRFIVRNWSLPNPDSTILPKPEAAEYSIVIPAPELPPPPPVPSPANVTADSYQAALESYDREIVAKVLEQAGGSIREAARRLGLSRNGLRSKVRKYGLGG